MTKEDLDRREIYRYLGYRNEMPEERIVQKVEAAVDEMIPRLTPKSVIREFPLEFSGPETTALRFADTEVVSKALTRHLKGCSSVLLFALTVGPEPDRLIRRAEVNRISDAVILQAVAAAAVESEADRLNGELREVYEKRGFLLKTRFSPGYGDFDLIHQKDVVRILNTPKLIGLGLTEGLLLTPSKSITALIGVYPKEGENETGERHENRT